MDLMVKMMGVAKEFGSQKAVNDMSLSIATGQAVAMLGPNGAGKTTIIAMMLGLLRPTSGHVRLWGSDPADARIHPLKSIVVPHIGKVPIE